ncbi:MAG TPA: MFS transporter [Thermoanaerobaculia bacterium]|nr:MFS transporter [Thermoanaerobaculia bacterium]
MSREAIPAKPKKLSTWQSLVKAFTSWRTASVSLMSFSSGLPLGLVWIAIPDWMRDIGVDIRVVGLITLAQAPWTFKFLWAPLMDRYFPRRLGRRRGWIAISQLALFAFTLMLAGVGHHPETPWVVGALALAIAFAAATQDIAVDAYAVDVLRPEEQALAVGARNFIYRIGMIWIAGGLAITLAGTWGWPAVNAALALLYLPLLIVTWKAPEPLGLPEAPKTLKEAVWYPFLGFLSRHRALEILSFVLLYKFADNLVQSLQRPFLIDMGYNEVDRGVALSTVGVVGNVFGTLVGGLLTAPLGLGRALWIFGFFQIFSNAGYAILAAQDDVNRPLMLAAIGFETLSSGLGSGAFSVLLLRMTQKRFSATQYALFSSLFGLPRILSGPIAGYAAYAYGWEAFFWATLPVGIPGMILLSRFVPWNAREVDFQVEPPSLRKPLGRGELFLRGLAGTVVGTVVAALITAALSALKVLKDNPAAPFDLLTPLVALVRPVDGGGWLTLLGLLTFGIVCGLFTAAVTAARHGAGQELALEEARPDLTSG